MNLTANQLAVVEHEGPRVFVAGPAGTGKTTALAARYRRLAGAGRRVLVVGRDRASAHRFWLTVQDSMRGTGFDALPVTSPLSLAYDFLTRAGRTVNLVLGAEQRALVRDLLATEDSADWPLLGRLLDRPGFAEEVMEALGHPAGTSPRGRSWTGSWPGTGRASQPKGASTCPPCWPRRRLWRRRTGTASTTSW